MFLPRRLSIIVQCFILLVGYTSWPRDRRRASAAACLLGLRFRIPPGAWMSFSCECCLLSSRGLASSLSLVQRGRTDCGVFKCDRETSTMRRPWPSRGCCAMEKKNTLSDTHAACVATTLALCIKKRIAPGSKMGTNEDHSTHKKIS
jgi:hypothetical protein